MSPIRPLIVALSLLGASAAAAEPRTLTGLKTPESAAIGADGRLYVSEIGGFGQDGDGRISVVGASGQLQPFATGLDDPKGLVAFKDGFFVTDKTRVWKIDAKGQATVFAKADAFAQPPLFLNDIVADADGTLYVSDSGDTDKGVKGAIYRIAPDGRVSLLVGEAQNPAIKNPNGLLLEGPGKLLVVDFFSGELHRIDLATKSLQKLADGFGGGDGLARDAAGMLYISDWKGGRVFKLDLQRAGAKPERYEQSFKAAADLTLSRDGQHLLVPDMKAGTLVWLPK